MIIIGITGSIGKGKTTIASMLKFFKIPIFDSDLEVKMILENDAIVINKIYRIWPETVFIKNKKVNKSLLANRIFASKKSRKQLESIIHPIVKKKRNSFIEENQSSFIVGLDVPLLYETGTDKICDYVLLADTSEKIQKERVLSRPNMTEKKFNLIKNSQWDDKKKKEKKPFIIDTSFGKFVSLIILLSYLIKIIISGKND